MSAVQVAEAPKSQSRFAHPRKPTAISAPPIIVADQPLADIEKFEEFHLLVYGEGRDLFKTIKKKRRFDKTTRGIIAEAKYAYRGQRERKCERKQFEENLLSTEKGNPRVHCGYLDGKPCFVTSRFMVEKYYDQWIKDADKKGDRNEVKYLQTQKRGTIRLLKEITEARISESRANGYLAVLIKERAAEAYYSEIRYAAFHAPIKSEEDCRLILDFIAWSCRVHYRDAAVSYIQSAVLRVNKFLLKKTKGAR